MGRKLGPSPALAIRAASPFPGFERIRLPIKIQVRRTVASFTNPVIPLYGDSTQGDVDARVANGRVTFHRKSLQTDSIPFTKYAISPLHKRSALIIKPNNKISFWNLWFDSRVGHRVARPGKEILTVPYTFDAEYDIAHFSNDESVCMLITQGRMNNRQKHADIPHTATLYDIVTGRLIKPDKQKTDGLYFTGTSSTPRVTGNQVVLEVRSRAAPHTWTIP